MSDNAILRMRRDRNMTQSRLAEACGVSVRTVRRAEQGLPLSDETVLALCAVLGCGAGDLAPVHPDDPGESVRKDPAVDPGRLAGAVALGLVLSALLFLASFEVAYMLGRSGADHVPYTDPGVRRLTAVFLCLMYATGLGIPGMLAPVAAGTLPRVRPWLDRMALTGPCAMAVSAGLLTPIPGAMAGFEVAGGHIVEGTLPIMGSGAMAASMAFFCVLGHYLEKGLLLRFLRAVTPALFSAAILVEALGVLTGNVAAGAFGTILLLPTLASDRARAESLTVAFGVAMLAPLLVQPYVGILLGVSQGPTDLVTVVACLGSDALAIRAMFGNGGAPPWKARVA